MKPIPLLVAALVALLFGGVGYFVGVESGARAAPALADHGADQVDAPARSAESVSRQDATHETADREPKPDSTATKPLTPGTLDQWFALLADEKPAPGSGRIDGRIATKAAVPVAGVVVTAAVLAPRDEGADDGKPVRELVESYARRTHFERAGVFTTKTDAAGRYAFANLGDYEFWVSAEGAGFECSPVGESRVRPDATLDFEASPVCELELDIRMPDGTEPSSASVYLSVRGDGSSIFYWTPVFKTHRTEPGNVKLDVRAGVHEEFVSETHPIELREGAPPLKLLVQLRTAPGIHCRLVMPQGWPASRGINITLEASPSPDPPTPSSMRGLRNVERVWDNDGGATFKDLSPGKYRLIATAGNKVLAWTDAQLGENFLEVDITVPEPEPADFIVVRVTAPDGTPVKDAQLDVSTHGENFGSSGGAIVLARPDGSSWILRSPPDSARAQREPWWYQIRASSPEFGVAEVRYPSDASHEIKIQYRRPATLTVQVPGAASHPLRTRLQPQLWRADGGGVGWSGVYDAGGPGYGEGLASDIVKYGPLSPGRYRFSLHLSDDSRNFNHEGQLAEWVFEIVEGDNAQSCPVPRLYKLTLVLADPKAVQRLSLDRSGANSSRNYSGEDLRERMTFENLPSGEWVISTREGEMRVNLTGDTEVKLAVRKYDCILLTGIRGGGKIEALGLRDGDKVIRVDGEEVENAQATMDVQLIATLAKDNTTWTVLRAGARVDVTFNGKELMKIMGDRNAEGGRERFRPQAAMRD